MIGAWRVQAQRPVAHPLAVSVLRAAVIATLLLVVLVGIEVLGRPGAAPLATEPTDRAAVERDAAWLRNDAQHIPEPLGGRGDRISQGPRPSSSRT